MTIKDEMSPIKKYNYDDDLTDMKPKKKKAGRPKKDYNKEIKELRNCLKDKDKRISEIENWQEFKKCFYGSIIISLVCWCPWVWYIFFYIKAPIDTAWILDNIPFEIVIPAIIGYVALFASTFVVWNHILMIIWE